MAYSILLIDDSAVMRKIISRNLRRAGVTISGIQEAGNGLEGLEQLTQGTFDLIFCDINMPEMDGLTFLKELRSNSSYNQIRIIMLTTESGSEYKTEAQSNGANGYLIKPSTADEIEEKINAIMN